MQKVLVWGGVAFAAIVSLLFYFIYNFPAAKDPRLVQQYAKLGHELRVNGQANALDPNKNGYLSENFISYWGRDMRKGADSTELAKVVEAWKKYSSFDDQTFVPHSLLLNQKNSAYLSAEKAMLALEPELEKAMRRETFVAPEKEAEFEDDRTTTLQFPHLWNSVLAISALAESACQRGNADLGARRLETLFALSQAMNGKSAAFNDMFALRIKGLASSFTILYFSPQANLALKNRKQLAKAFLSTETPAMFLQRNLPLEVYMEQCLLKNVRQRGKSTSSTADTTSESGLFDIFQAMNRIPGLLAREERILANAWSGILEHYERTGQLVNPQEIDPSNLTWYDFISGRTGFAALVLCQDVESLQRGVQQTYPFYLGVGTAQALIAYHQEHNRYPQELQELAAIYSLPLQFKDLKFIYKPSPKGATLTINAPSSPRDYLQDIEKILVSSGQKKTWISLDKHEITFKI